MSMQKTLPEKAVEYHECDDPNLNSRYKIIISSYTSGSYEGSGEAYCLYDSPDGIMIDIIKCDHCSCYGPGDNGIHDTFSLQSFLDGDIGTESQFDFINKKIRELYA